MAVLYNGYAVPSGIVINTGPANYGDSHLEPPPFSPKTTIAADLNWFRELYIFWFSNYKTFQVQWKIRKRLSPAKAAAELAAYGTAMPEHYTQEGGDWWTFWPDTWSGNALTDDVKTNTVRKMSSMTYFSRTAEPIHVDYDLNMYDKWEVVVRVRAFDEPTLRCSEWGTSDVLSVCFMPRITKASVLYDDGSDTFTVNLATNWSRAFIVQGYYILKWYDTPNDYPLRGSLLSDAQGDMPGAIRGEGGSITYTKKANYRGRYFANYDDHVAVTIKNYGTDDVMAFSVLAKRGGAQVLLEWMWPDDLFEAHTHDVGYNGWDINWVVVGKAPLGEPAESPPISLSVDAEQDGTALSVHATATGSSPDTVYADVHWTDQRGTVRAQQIEMAEDGDGWAGGADYVPFDVPLTVSVTAVKDGGSVRASREVIVSSNGIVELSWPGSSTIKLRFNPERSNDYSMNAEAVQTAGRELPVSRYGIGGELQLSLSGVLLEPPEPCGESSIADTEPLKERHDWIVRYPGGEMYRAAVLSHSLSSTYSTGHRQVELSIRMEALGYGVD